MTLCIRRDLGVADCFFKGESSATLLLKLKSLSLSLSPLSPPSPASLARETARASSFHLLSPLGRLKQRSSLRFWLLCLISESRTARPSPHRSSSSSSVQIRPHFRVRLTSPIDKPCLQRAVLCSPVLGSRLHLAALLLALARLPACLPACLPASDGWDEADLD